MVSLSTGCAGFVRRSQRVLGCRDLDAGGDGIDPVDFLRRPIPGNMYRNLFPERLVLTQSVVRAINGFSGSVPKISLRIFNRLIRLVLTGGDGGLNLTAGGSAAMLTSGKGRIGWAYCCLNPTTCRGAYP